MLMAILESSICHLKMSVIFSQSIQRLSNLNCKGGQSFAYVLYTGAFNGIFAIAFASNIFIRSGTEVVQRISQ